MAVPFPWIKLEHVKQLHFYDEDVWNLLIFPFFSLSISAFAPVGTFELWERNVERVIKGGQLGGGLLLNEELAGFLDIHILYAASGHERPLETFN